MTDPAGPVALLVVDAQRTFMPGGELPVPGGDAIIDPLCERIASGRYAIVVFSRDWHPRDHVSFSHRPRFEHGSWPVHGVADTATAQVHPALTAAARDAGVAHLIVSKGMERSAEAYSAFDGVNLDTGATLEEELAAREIRALDVGGLAGEVCVEATVLDALRRGYDTNLLQSATGFLADPAPALDRIRDAGARIEGGAGARIEGGVGARIEGDAGARTPGRDQAARSDAR